ncbi:MAG: FAD-dependent thymidylate synthase [Clostridia bacterium]|nr:FAD-dependent thymidylate synthase [Clostridia bacterium]
MANPGVYLIGISDCDEKVCAAAGRISTQEGTALEIFDKSQDKEKNQKLINKVTKSGHTSTIEHVFFNLAFENVSVVVEQFLIEFRLASFTVKSRRYVDFSNAGYFMPEFKSCDDEKMYTETMNDLFSAYITLTEKGIPKEDARFVLPYCFYSNFLCSLGGRELINLLNAMIYGRGRKIKEIYELGLSLYSQCKEKTPGIFSDFELRGEKYADDIDLDFTEEKERDESAELCEILSFTADGEKNIARSVLIEKYNYSSVQIENIIANKDNVNKILAQITKSSRARALESFNCTVRFNKVSLACLTHFARHRIQSISIPQLILTDRESYIIPETIKENKDCYDLYCSCFERMKNLFYDFRNKGYDESVLVYLVLSGNTLDFVTTMNAREMMLFFRLRSCTRAQWEIQEFAVDFLKKLRKIAPDLFSFYGPSCYATGYCPEGRMTCGRASEIKEKFKVL